MAWQSTSVHLFSRLLLLPEQCVASEAAFVFIRSCSVPFSSCTFGCWDHCPIGGGRCNHRPVYVDCIILYTSLTIVVRPVRFLLPVSALTVPLLLVTLL